MPVFSGGRRIPAHPVRPSFRDPRFALLLVGQSAGWVCSWAASLVLWGFAAYHFGANPAGISLTALCWSGPPVVLTAFTGGLTDRFGPRTMLIIGYTCSAAASLGMSVSGSLTSLDIMALACGAARSLCSPASSALPTRIVESDDLLAANSLLGVTASIGQVAGPLAASVLMATAGFRIAFTADAIMYLVGALVLIPLPVLPLPEEPRNAGATATRRPVYGLSWFRTAMVGAVAVAREPGLRAIALARMGVIFTSGAFLVIEPLYTRHVLHQPSSQFARFEAATGIGAVVTGLLLPVIRRRVPGIRSPMWLLTAGAVSCGLAAALSTGTPWVLVAYLGAFVWGVCDTVFYAVAATTLQRLAPTGKLGRVSGVISTAESTTQSLSMPVAGALVAVVGLQPGALLLAAVAVAAGAVCLLGVAGNPTTRSRSVRTAEYERATR
ncbi:MFS transporter [Actinoallomurus sp. NBC_01490]|uniref:MFS transporter n=1 Tax=Actinoallomurus sp. NBC_01490 TaxID=2903557 RepID=UPI002E31FC6D|nr:MFS transporter [Actinoallomurus sp. NBC_01490]